MIKFFRTIRQNLLNEGKTSKYLKYAIGEIVLVMIGILLALQVNNWNESRKERIIEKDVLNDILTNLEQNNNLIHKSLAMLEGFDNSSDIVLEALSQKRSYSDTLAKHFFAATRSGGLLFPLSSAGYESLKNEGFNIIRSDSLKDQIMDLFIKTAYDLEHNVSRSASPMPIAKSDQEHSMSSSNPVVISVGEHDGEQFLSLNNLSAII